MIVFKMVLYTITFSYTFKRLWDAIAVLAKSRIFSSDNSQIQLKLIYQKSLEIYLFIIPIHRDEANLKKGWDIDCTNKKGYKDGIQLSKDKDQLRWEVTMNRKNEEFQRHDKNCWKDNHMYFCLWQELKVSRFPSVKLNLELYIFIFLHSNFKQTSREPCILSHTLRSLKY